MIKLLISYIRLLGLFFIILAFFRAPSVFADISSKFITNNIDGSQTISGHVPLIVKNGQAVYKSHFNDSMTVFIIMPLSNQEHLKNTLHCLYDTHCQDYHQWLTPDQFANAYGASSIDIQTIQKYFSDAGIQVTRHPLLANVLSATGPSSAFEQSLSVHINQYQKLDDGKIFFAPDSNPSIPAFLAGKILAFGGLDNLPKFKPHLQSSVPSLQVNSSITPQLGTGPGGFLAPNDIKTAYNLNSIHSSGIAQNVALFELDGYNGQDIVTYDAYFNLPKMSIKNIYIDHFSGIPNYDQSTSGAAQEVTLDIELINAFAPSSSNIMVYEASNTTQGWVDEWAQIAAENKAKIISCSWGSGEEDSSTINFDNMIFQQLAAQGQSVFVASGDAGAYVNGNSSEEPAVQPYVTAVGISTLSINRDGTYKSEAASIYGGGGISLYQSIPSYQQQAALKANTAAMVSTTMRNVPDVALTADASTQYAFYINGNWGSWSGSSLSAPIWAAFITSINQSLDKTSVGFVNPMLYEIANGSSYTNDFHQITTGTNGYYPAEAGYNDATGLGSFNGANLYQDLISMVKSNLAPAAPAGLQARAGNAQVVLSWQPSAGATTYSIERSTRTEGPFVVIGSTKGVNSFYVDNSVSNAIIYYYVVVAVNANGKKTDSVQVSATPNFQWPSSPSSLTAKAGIAQVALAWNAVTQAVSYNIKRSTSSFGPFAVIASSYIPSYTDTSVKKSIPYYYVVSAVNTAGQGPNSLPSSATPQMAVPACPQSPFAIANNHQVDLFWYPPSSGGATSYNVKRSTKSGGPYTTIASSVMTKEKNPTQWAAQANVYTYSDNAVKNGITYYYVISANDSVGQGPISSEISATPNLPPTAPTGLAATSGSQGIVLTWNTISGYSYYVKRSTNKNGPFLLITTTPIQQNSFTDNAYVDSVSYGTTYYYVVSATNNNLIIPIQGPNSNSVSAVFTVKAPGAITGLQALAGNQQVALTWTASGNTDSYTIFRADTNGGSFQAVGSGSANSFTETIFSDMYYINEYFEFFLSLITNGHTYYYMIQAQGPGGTTSSNTISATPQAY